MKQALLLAFSASSLIVSVSIQADEASTAKAIPTCEQPVTAVRVEGIICELPQCFYDPTKTSGRKGLFGFQGPATIAKVAKARGDEGLFSQYRAHEKMTNLLVAALKETRCFDVIEPPKVSEAQPDGSQPAPKAEAPAVPPVYTLKGKLETMDVSGSVKMSRWTMKDTSDFNATVGINVSIEKTAEATRVDSKQFESKKRKTSDRTIWSGYNWSRQADSDFGDTVLGDAVRDVIYQGTVFLVEKLAQQSTVSSRTGETPQ